MVSREKEEISMTIIAVCGIDASGKGTQVNLLAEYTRKHWEFDKVETQHFPDYDSVTGKVIQSLLKGDILADSKYPPSAPEHLEHIEHCAAVIMQSLMVTNRMEISWKLRYFESTSTELLILDRYSASGMVYGGADGLDPDFLEKIQWLLPGPYHWLLIDIPVEESFRRRPERADYYECDRPKLELIRKLYIELFTTKNHNAEVPWTIIDGLGTPDQVLERIVEELGKGIV